MGRPLLIEDAKKVELCLQKPLWTNLARLAKERNLSTAQLIRHLLWSSVEQLDTEDHELRAL